jgi:hypothetical protein
MTARAQRSTGGFGFEMDWVRFVYSPFAARAARHVLIGRLRRRRAPEQGRFSRADVEIILKGAWADYRQRTPDLPRQPTIGSAMNLRLACFTMSFFDALLSKGVEREYAIEIVADATWRVYRLWAKIAMAVARLSPKERHRLASPKLVISAARSR